MSRVGNKPITIPSSVTIELDGTNVKVKGPKGELSCLIPDTVSHELNEGVLTFSRKGNRPQLRANHGLARALVNNLVIGVTEGFKKGLEMAGTGYKWEVRGKEVVLNVGFSHAVHIAIPDGISIEIAGMRCAIEGIDKQLVGFVAAQIRRVRPPEPYKGKGIKYAGEIIRRKAGKAGV